MPAKPQAIPLLPALAVALAALTACCLAQNATDADVRNRQNDRAPHSEAVVRVPGDAAGPAEGRGGQFELIATSATQPNRSKQGPPEDMVASSDLPAADKQYDYPLVRPVYAPFVTRPTLSNYAVPYVEILEHHRDPPYTKPSPPHYMTGSPMVSTVVVQDLSQSPSTPRPPHQDVVSLVDGFHHLAPTKIPFTNVQVMTKPLGGGEHGVKKQPNFTDKLQETSLEQSGASGSAEEDDDDDDGEPLLEDPPNLDVGGIVEDVVKKVFRENPVLRDAIQLMPPPEAQVTAWPCPPVTCCSRATSKAPRRCSTFVKCEAGRSRACLPRADDRLPQALALSGPSTGHTNATATRPEADVRDGTPQPRFKKKKILKKKKKLLKKFLLPLLLAYKLLFLMVVPMMVNGMMMMMSSSGMTGFFFALIGASITMVRVYNGSIRHEPAPPPPPPPNKVVKVIKYVQTTPTATPSPSPPPTTTHPPTVIHHQPFIEEHYPTYHPPHHHPAHHHPSSFGSYYPSPYWTRNYDRSEGALDGGRKKRRRTGAGVADDGTNEAGLLFNAADNQIWLV